MSFKRKTTSKKGVSKRCSEVRVCHLSRRPAHPHTDTGRCASPTPPRTSRRPWVKPGMLPASFICKNLLGGAESGWGPRSQPFAGGKTAVRAHLESAPGTARRGVGGFARRWARGGDHTVGGFTFLDQDAGNQINQIRQEALESCKDFVGGRESLRLAPTLPPRPHPALPRPPAPLCSLPQAGRAATRRFPGLRGSPALLGPKGNAGSGSARGSSTSRRGKGGGESGGGRREEEFLGGRECGGDRGGGAPFPPRADCCGLLPVPARECGGSGGAGSARWG